MPVRFAINGLGRIGRALARIAGERPRLGLVAVNDLQEAGTVDLPLLQHVDERPYRVVSWYDNEWGYAHRLAELLEHLEESR